ncbi:MAG TPA: site-specific integrase, partial [Nitrospiraceae bacterium]
MTRLRKMMLEELQRRNFSEDTIRHYIRAVEDFARHFNRPPDRLGTRHIREYQVQLFQKRKLSSGSVTYRLAALRFFYTRRSRRLGVSPRGPTRKRIIAFQQSSARKKSHDSS